MSKRSYQYKEDYKKYLESKGKLPDKFKRLTDYDKPSDEAPNYLKLHKKRLDQHFGLSGVYVLLKGNKIVYVGESSCIMTRLSQHYKEGIKDFDYFFYEVYKTEKQRKNKEKQYIKRFRPKYNLVHNPNLK